jgi:hypothetical protein
MRRGENEFLVWRAASPRASVQPARPAHPQAVDDETTLFGWDNDVLAFETMQSRSAQEESGEHGACLIQAG